MTRAYREGRASRLESERDRRKAEAEVVRDAVLEAARDERGLYQFSDPRRELPGASPEVKSIIRRWDAELSVRTIGARRLHRSENEPLETWRRRVLIEAERRIESKWHDQRAGGQRTRFQRVAACGTKIRGRVACRACSAAGEWMPDLCNVALLCQRCRELRIRRYRGRVAQAMQAAHDRAKRFYLAPGQAKRDPVIARFLTLTCPHIPIEHGGPERQAKLCRVAWRGFMNALRNRWRAVAKESRPKRWRDVLDASAFVRCLEFTAGEDDLGHVHMHAWILSTFTRAQVLRVLWGRALTRAKDPETKELLFPRELWPEQALKSKRELLAELSGEAKVYEQFGIFVRELGRGNMRAAVAAHAEAHRAAEGGARGRDRLAWRYVRRVCPQSIPYPRVDVRLVNERGDLESGGSVVAELVKYLCKDFEATENGQTTLIDPELFAAVYRGLDSGRLLSAARGFWIKLRVLCPCCGAWGALRLVICTPEQLAAIEAQKARAPPAEQMTQW